MIAQKSIQEVFAAAQVEEVVSEFVNLKKRGINRIGLCPFHDEKTPSFTVSPNKNIYKCFGCGKGGNAVNFLMEVEKLSFVEAIRYLATKYNIKLEETGQDKEEYEQEKKQLDSLFIVNNYAEEQFRKNLLETDEGRSIGLSYFRERGYRENIIDKFGLGYATKERKDLLTKAKKAQYNMDFLRELGLVSEKGYDFFNGRVMFTIHNLSGKPIAFAGRILQVNKKAPKYINSPESQIYNKRKILYGMYQAKNAIRKEDFCIMVEGYTDVISLHQHGIENAVASSGTSLTTEQLRLVKRFTNNLTILYDGDKAGINAALRGLDLALESDLNTRIAVLPENEDPDSFVKKVGYEDFKEFLAKESKDFIFFKLDLAMDGSENDPIKKSELVRDMVATLSKIKDTIKRSAYIQQVSSRLRIDERILVKETNKFIREVIRKRKQQQEREEARKGFQKQSNDSDPPFGSDFPMDEQHYFDGKEEESYYEAADVETKPKQKTDFGSSGDVYQEKDLVRIVISLGSNVIKDEEGDMTVAEYIYHNIAEVIEYFDNPIYKDIIIESVQRAENGEKIESTYFTNHMNPEIQRLAIELLATPHNYARWADKGVYLQNQNMPDKNFSNDSWQSIVRFKYRKIKRIMELLQKRIEAAEKEENWEDLRHLMKAYQKLQEEKTAMASHRGIVIG